MTETPTHPRPPGHADVSDDDARRLVLALCPLAGDHEAVTGALLTLTRDADPRRLLTLTLTALAVIFTEALTEPVPTPRRTAA